MLIDLHCHTARYSACSSLTPEHLLEQAARAGLDGVCLTEHDRLWPDDELAQLRTRSPIVVLRGIEVTTELGHVLVFGLARPPIVMAVAATLLQHVRQVGGVSILAHPVRPGQPLLPHRQCADLFDTVEAVNGSDGADQQNTASALAERMTLPGVGGSDCHAPSEIGTAATWLPHRVTTEAGLIAALRLRQHRAVRLPFDRPGPEHGG